MKIFTFKYTKADGKVSNRVLLPLRQPVENYSGIDLSELDDEAIGIFVSTYNKLYDEFQAKVAELTDEYDLKHSYRQFDPAKMSEVVTDVI